ncbi:MAG TPA: cellulase family glycosylhydrolase [Polyangiaceae bacterium]|nr:cellulase family glycosylhydrolase [Polyangiaceae bacterium]
MRLSLGSATLACTACGGWDALPPEPPPALHVAGNRIHDADGSDVVLRGVNRSGTEYRCVQARAETDPEHYFFDGPGDAASIAAMASWNITAIRLPLNETCWLGINGVLPESSGENYRTAIEDYVELILDAGLFPILDLHWAAPGEVQARRLQPMPNRDHSADFWRSVAERFKHEERVVFEPYNEPFPFGNSNGPAAWDCWQNGCPANLSVRTGDTSTEYDGASVGELVNAIRETGARNLILLAGVQYANTLDEWLERAPDDPMGNLAASWHVYNTNPCRDAACWNGVPAAVAQKIPIVATEVGQNDCGESDFVAPLLDFLDANGSGYLAWSWNAYGECRPLGAMPRPNPWSLVTDYDSGTPNGGYAQIFYDHLESLR